MPPISTSLSSSFSSRVRDPPHHDDDDDLRLLPQHAAGVLPPPVDDVDAGGNDETRDPEDALDGDEELVVNVNVDASQAQSDGVVDDDTTQEMTKEATQSSMAAWTKKLVPILLVMVVPVLVAVAVAGGSSGVG